MKTRLDKEGRVLIPFQIRKELELVAGSEVEINSKAGQAIVTKTKTETETCMCCKVNPIQVPEFKICIECGKKIVKTVGGQKL